MFAPYCSSCQARILLGVESVVAYDSADGHHTVVLRCHAGHLVSWDAEPPRPAAAPAPAPTPPPSRRSLGLGSAARPAPAPTNRRRLGRQRAGTTRDAA